MSSKEIFEVITRKNPSLCFETDDQATFLCRKRIFALRKKNGTILVFQWDEAELKTQGWGEEDIVDPGLDSLKLLYSLSIKKSNSAGNRPSKKRELLMAGENYNKKKYFCFSNDYDKEMYYWCHEDLMAKLKEIKK